MATRLTTEPLIDIAVGCDVPIAMPQEEKADLYRHLYVEIMEAHEATLIRLRRLFPGYQFYTVTGRNR